MDFMTSAREDLMSGCGRSSLIVSTVCQWQPGLMIKFSACTGDFLLICIIWMRLEIYNAHVMYQTQDCSVIFSGQIPVKMFKVGE